MKKPELLWYKVEEEIQCLKRHRELAMDLSHVTPIHPPSTIFLEGSKDTSFTNKQTTNNKTENQTGEGVPSSLDSSLVLVLCRKDGKVDTSLTSMEMVISWSG